MAAKTVSLKTGGIGLDTTDFAKFAKALRKAEPVLAKGLQTSLRAAGMIVAEAAKSNAAEFSESIPPSIKVRVSGATVSVVAGGNGIPIAGLYEIGNEGMSSGATFFYHPVFGRKPSVKQTMHPYLLPAVTSSADAAQAAAVEALDEAIAIAIAD